MQKNFLQSVEWRKFQESVERKTFSISSPHPNPCLPTRQTLPNSGEENFEFHASIIEHELPIVGKYFYIPRGPIISEQRTTNNEQLKKLLDLAKENKASWIRIEPENEEVLKKIKNIVGNAHARSKNRNAYMHSLQYKIVKAPHDIQPKETLIIDISKSEEELLAEMKSKTRYNIKLAEKKGVSITTTFIDCHPELVSGSREMLKQVQHDTNFYIEEFLRLTKIMSERQSIATHRDDYYRKMFEILPSRMIKLYVAEYEKKIIATNIAIFYGDTCTYLHGASDDKYKNLMAPHLLQWRQIQDAKKQNCTKYDFCGVKVKNKKGRSWEGITKFKLSFSPNTSPIEYPGSYDIIISPTKYWAYRFIQKIKNFF